MQNTLVGGTLLTRFGDAKSCAEKHWREWNEHAILYLMHAVLKVLSGDTTGRLYVIRVGQTFVLGRGQGAAIRFNDSVVSRKHATLTFEPDGKLLLTDLDSANGTFLRGQQIKAGEPQSVRSGDAITIGGSVLNASIEDDTDAARDARQLAQQEDSGILPDGFEILGTIGEGAYGRVYAARQVNLGRNVAVKVLNRDAAHEGDEAWERLLREGQTCCRLESPFVVRVYDIRVGEGRIYLVMELINGPTIQDRLAGGPMPIAEALQIAEQTALGLQDVHAAGVIHRDVKPSNIMVTPQGVAKLGDFGLAKDLTVQSELTKTDFGLGSLPFVSPEQATNAKKVDARSDVYGLGATLYNMLAGRPPFSPRSPGQLLRMLDKQPEPVRSLRPDCPFDVARLVHALIEKDPAARPPNAASVARQLREVRELHYPDVSAIIPDQRHRETARLPQGYYVPKKPTDGGRN